LGLVNIFVKKVKNNQILSNSCKKVRYKRNTNTSQTEAAPANAAEEEGAKEKYLEGVV
jgi:hypothetical protein